MSILLASRHLKVDIPWCTFLQAFLPKIQYASSLFPMSAVCPTYLIYHCFIIGIDLVFLRSVRRLLDTASVVPSSCPERPGPEINCSVNCRPVLSSERAPHFGIKNLKS
jgi:uncharacterized membrane protein